MSPSISVAAQIRAELAECRCVAAAQRWLPDEHPWPVAGREPRTYLVSDQHPGQILKAVVGPQLANEHGGSRRKDEAGKSRRHVASVTNSAEERRAMRDGLAARAKGRIPRGRRRSHRVPLRRLHPDDARAEPRQLAARVRAGKVAREVDDQRSCQRLHAGGA